MWSWLLVHTVVSHLIHRPAKCLIINLFQRKFAPEINIKSISKETFNIRTTLCEFFNVMTIGETRTFLGQWNEQHKLINYDR